MNPGKIALSKPVVKILLYGGEAKIIYKGTMAGLHERVTLDSPSEILPQTKTGGFSTNYEFSIEFGSGSIPRDIAAIRLEISGDNLDTHVATLDLSLDTP